ncbi:MAG TPA: hypothetical protein DDW17_01645 [Deltaproteobacteria bacterium]|nr:hypothetical protein [Deltaproteobacteria bacterium]
MITAERKPITEIEAMLNPFRRILVVGCGTCVAECAAGGEKEVALLSSALRMDARLKGRKIEVGEVTIDRQCVYEFINELTGFVDHYDAILSLGCGAGVQAVAGLFPKMPVLPGLNTKFIGETKETGLWIENCRACGDCKLGYFAGVCPLTRCAKGLLNGPCGGSKNGVCETNPDTPCAWEMIIDRLEGRGQIDLLQTIFPPVDWSKYEGKGPRKIEREDQRSGS